MAIINGKKPASQKPAPSKQPLSLDDIFGNPMGVQPEVVAYVESKGLAYRWVNASNLAKNGGYHDKGWRPLKRSECATMVTDSIFGQSPDDYFRRGDAVLAVRAKEVHEKHRAYLRQQAQRGKDIQRQQAQELRKYAKSSGLDMKVHEGYEDDNQE
jgi:hypothetical protein